MPGNLSQSISSLSAFGEEDDLERVNGIGPMLAELLNEIGVYYFWQIAEWGPAEIAGAAWAVAKLLERASPETRDVLDFWDRNAPLPTHLPPAGLPPSNHHHHARLSLLF